MKFPEMRKGSASRKFGYGSASKSHRRGSAFSLIGASYGAIGEESSSPSTSGSSSGDTDDYGLGIEYSSKSGKSSKKRPKSKKR